MRGEKMRAFMDGDSLFVVPHDYENIVESKCVILDPYKLDFEELRMFVEFMDIDDYGLLLKKWLEFPMREEL